MIRRSLLLILLIAGGALCQDCGQGWLQYQDQCVLLVSITLPFFTAQEYCQNQHADLIVLKDQAMNDWLKDHISIYNIAFWIGLLDRVEDSTFKWVDGSPMTFSNWAPGEPNNAEIGSEDCVEIYNSGKWNDEQCLAFQYFACSKKSGDIPQCDVENFWESYGSKCYRWILDTKSVDDATTYCTLMDGNVISINNAAEQAFADNMQQRHLNLEYWTGLSDKGQARGSYVWPDGTTPASNSYSNWDANQPDTSQFPGCAYNGNQMRGSANWSIDDCATNRQFICEKDEGTCADGWILHGGQCYQYNFILRTWFDAKYYCEAQGGWLATVSDGNENTFIASNMDLLRDENVQSMWIGLSDTEGDGDFKWVHQTISTYDHWQPGKPVNTYAVADCAYMNTADSTGTWYQMQCTLLAGFACKIKAGTTPSPVDDNQVGSCETGWALYGDSCYFWPDKTKNFADAQTECRALFPSRSDLASIHSYGEQSFLTERQAFINDATWIGLNDQAQEGTYMWTDGTPYDFQNWAPGEPNNKGGNEDCVHIEDYFYKIGMWNDLSCDRQSRYVCKMPKYQTPPATVTPPPTLPPADKCGTDWIYDSTGNNCYKFVMGDSVAWLPADDQCHYEGGNLVSILSGTETDYISQIMNYYKKSYNVYALWIGLHDTHMEHGYSWTDGSPLAYLNWNAGEPNDAGNGEDCAEFLTDNGKWNDMPCDAERPYVCKRNPLITQQFVSYPNARLDTSQGENPVGNLWPEECAFDCYVLGSVCRAFNYQRNTRQCTILYTDKDTSSATLIPEFEDPWDYYQKDFSGPPYAPPTTIDPSYGCRQGEFGYRGYCYTLVDSLASFSDMQDICALRSSDLVSIADRSELNFVISLMQTGNSQSKTIGEVWLGLTDQDVESTFAWTDGSPVTFTQWAAEEPAVSGNNDDCVVHNYNMNGWRAYRCVGSTAYGVCKKPKVNSNIVPPSNDGCPPNWVKYMSSCYSFVSGDTSKLTWQDAKNRCVERGGRLTTITSNYEQAFLASQMGAIIDYNGDYWIGLSDTEIQGTYTWVDGTYPVIAAWGPGQPDDSLFGQCVALIGGLDPDYAGMWMDENCYKGHNYICEMPVEGATDTPYTQPPATSPSNLGCDDGAIGYGSSCFIVFEMELSYDQQTWSGARTECQKIGGDLASFGSAAEEKYLRDTFTPSNPDDMAYGFWLGINDQMTEGGWEWSDGSPVVYVNWGSGEPNDHSNSEDCVEMWLSEGRGWNDVTCYAYRNWVCKKPKDLNGSPTMPPIGECPSDPEWIHARPYCYYFSDLIGDNDRLSWTEAENYCLTKGGHLVSIENAVENQLIMNMAPVLGTDYWIGLRQYTTNGPYVWSDDTPYLYANWDQGEPNNHNGEEMCAEIYRYDGLSVGGVWNDAACGVRAPYICKKVEDNIVPITSAPTSTPVGGCSNGYFKYFNRCYRLGGYDELDRYSWKDARVQCQKEGGNLAGIHGKEVQSLLTSMLIDMTGDVWIGLSDLGSTGSFHWTDGKYTTYTNWYPGEPSGIINLPDAPVKDCVELMNNEVWYAGMWHTADCGNVIGYLCEKDLEPGVPDNPPPNTLCSDTSYYRYGDSCLKVDTTPRSFDAAQEFCTSEGGNLASITNAYYEAFVEYLLFTSGTTQAWIGMSSNSDGEYSWNDGWPVLFSKWGENEPSQNAGEGCVVLTDDPFWNDISCSETRPTICRTTSSVPPAPPEEFPGTCPAGTMDWSGHCYWVPEDFVFLEWYSARVDCQTRFGGDLASIHSKSENEFVRSLVYGVLGRRTVWLGLTRSATGGFEWSDQTPVDYVHWANGEPSYDWRGTEELCTEMYTDEFGSWNDQDCYLGASYVCKMDKYRNDTNSQPVTSGSGLSAGAIAGIVIASIVVILALILVIGWFVKDRGSQSANVTSSKTADPFPASPSGFDNVVYTSDNKDPSAQVEDKDNSNA